MRIYLDASPVIYLVERVAPFAAAVTARLATPGAMLVASDLTRMECLVRPLRAGDATLVQNYEDFFAAQVGELVPFTTAVFRRAASIRAKENIKTPDALHLAAAVEAGCASFLTNDAQLVRFTGIAVAVVA